MKKKKKKIKKLSYPQQLNREDYFKCPIWFADEPQFVDDLNKVSDKYIAASRKNIQPDINKRNKLNKTKGDLGSVYHSSTLIGDPAFKDLINYIGATSHNLLIEMGFDMTNHQLFTTEMWVQEFAKNGGGHHALHTHWNGHMSGFYFLKASDKTSMPMFEDPRAGNLMNLLPEKDKTKITYASSQVHYKVQPGRMIFFPSYMPHQYIIDMGIEPFRFIHWNCQAIPKGVLNVVQEK
tara:strand:+ start:2353 stop:3060 length:708 start_codon:yes stop_codon:yes gene_type:complete